MPTKKANNGCGCASTPFSLILVMLGAGYWGFRHLHSLDISKFLPNTQQPTASNSTPVPSQRFPVSSSPIFPKISKTKPQTPISVTPKKLSLFQAAWEKKAIQGIYLSRYQVTNNASEQTIRERVRYDRSQGINTIIHGVWGNGCTMYNFMGEQYSHVSDAIASFAEQSIELDKQLQQLNNPKPKESFSLVVGIEPQLVRKIPHLRRRW